MRYTLLIAVLILAFTGCECSDADRAKYPERTSSVKMIFDNGKVDTVNVVYQGKLQLRGSVLIDDSPCNCNTYANDVSAFSVLITTEEAEEETQ